MAFEPGLGAACRAALKQAAGAELTDDEIKEVVDRMIRKKNALRREDPTLSENDALLAAGRRIGEDEIAAKQIEKRNRLINVMRKKERIAHYDQFGPGREYQAVKALLVGIESNDTNAGRSIDAERNGIIDGWTGPMVAELRSAGLLDVATRNDEQLNRDVAREMARVTNHIEKPTGNRNAESIAKIDAERRGSGDRKGAGVHRQADP
jgi:hypothetical protein